MDFFKDKEYKNGKPKAFPSPSRKKDDKFYLEYANAIYSEYVKDRGGIPYSRRFDFVLNRLYGAGNQPTTKYMDILCPLPQGKISDTDREGWMNISWDIISVIPKFKRIFVGMFEKIEHDVTCTAVNDQALAEKEDYKWNLWTESQMQEFYKSLNLPIDATPEWMPSTMQELEMFMGECFKLGTEMAMEMGIDYSFYLSKWPEIKKKMLEDAFDLGVFACQDYVDPIDNKVKVKYLDPIRLIVRYSREKDFSNIDTWGYIEEMTISQLRQRSGLTEEQLYQIAGSYKDYCDNYTNFGWEDYYNFSNLSSQNNPELPYDNYRVNVMFFEFITSESKVYKIVKGQDGSRKTFEKKSDYNPQDNNPDREVERHKYQVTMSGQWIIGTDYTFECGKSYMQPRENKKHPKLSLNIYKYADKSMCASIIPNADSFQIGWLKLQNAKAMASPAGLSIEAGMLENITIGGDDGKKFSPLEILTIRRSTGDLIYKATTHFSELLPGARPKPVEELKGGIGEQLNEFITTMDYDLKMIRDLTGINEAIDASSPQERVSVGGTEMAAEAANNSLQPIYSGYVSVKESAAKKITTRYQTMAADGSIKGYIPSLGKNIVKNFEITSAVSHEDYAIKIRVRPTGELKQAIRASALEAVKLGKKMGGITHSDYLYIEDKIQDGNLKYAWMFLEYKERKYQQEMERMQANNSAQNSQIAQAQEETKMKGMQVEIAAKTDSQVTLEKLQSDNRIKEEMVRHQNKMREIELTGQQKIENTVVNNETKPEKEPAEESAA